MVKRYLKLIEEAPYFFLTIHLVTIPLIILLIITLILLPGCARGAGGFDIGAFIKNPFISAIIVIAVLYYVFKSRGKK